MQSSIDNFWQKLADLILFDLLKNFAPEIDILSYSIAIILIIQISNNLHTTYSIHHKNILVFLTCFLRTNINFC